MWNTDVNWRYCLSSEGSWNQKERFLFGCKQKIVVDSFSFVPLTFESILCSASARMFTYLIPLLPENMTALIFLC